MAQPSGSIKVSIDNINKAFNDLNRACNTVSEAKKMSNNESMEASVKIACDGIENGNYLFSPELYVLYCNYQRKLTNCFGSITPQTIGKFIQQLESSKVQLISRFNMLNGHTSSMISELSRINPNKDYSEIFDVLLVGFKCKVNEKCVTETDILSIIKSATKIATNQQKIDLLKIIPDEFKEFKSIKLALQDLASKVEQKAEFPVLPNPLGATAALTQIASGVSAGPSPSEVSPALPNVASPPGGPQIPALPNVASPPGGPQLPVLKP